MLGRGLSRIFLVVAGVHLYAEGKQLPWNLVHFAGDKIVTAKASVQLRTQSISRSIVFPDLHLFPVQFSPLKHTSAITL